MPVVHPNFDVCTRKRIGTIAIANQLREEHAPAPAADSGRLAVHWITAHPTTRAGSAGAAQVRRTDPDTLHGNVQPWRSVMTGLDL